MPPSAATPPLEPQSDFLRTLQRHLRIDEEARLTLERSEGRIRIDTALRVAVMLRADFSRAAIAERLVVTPADVREAEAMLRRIAPSLERDQSF